MRFPELAAPALRAGSAPSGQRMRWSDVRAIHGPPDRRPAVVGQKSCLKRIPKVRGWVTPV